MNSSQLPQDQQTGATGTTTEGSTPQHHHQQQQQQQQPMPHIPSASQPHPQLQNYQPHQQNTHTPGFVKQMDMNQQYMPPTHQQQPHFQPPSQQTSPSAYYTQPNYPPPINYQQQQPPPPPPPPQQAQVPQLPQFQFDYSHSYTTQQSHHFPSTSSTASLPNNFQHFQPIHENTAQHPQSIQEQDSIQKRKRPRRQDSIHASAGESELKQMALQSTEVPLSDLAHKIKQLENDVSHSANSDQSKLKENKETQRSLFGMVWLLNSCELSPTAVIPRNRIYARYVQVCADNSLTPVSPASFGKLVKILYPNITTRRLGMRGQSKYHYCGIKLNGDENMQSQLLSLQHQQQQQQAQQSVQKQSHHHHHHQRSESMLSGFSGQAQSPMSSSSSVSYDESSAPMSRPHTPSFTPINSPNILFSTTLNDQLPSVSHMKYIPNLFQLLNSNADPSSNPYTPIQLPSIYPYLTRNADYDIADTLYSLYKVHVNAIFESLRYMQLKKLFSCFNNFNSILTAPVFKLYTSDSVTDWIMKCDLIMYKKMIRMLSKLQLQLLIPQEQLLQLKQIASGYIKSLATSLVNSKVSTNFVIMKLKLAKHFVNLLNRLIKVIETGQPASRILTDDTEKNSMIQDWTKLNLEEVISREMPCSDKNVECLNHILSSEVVGLIKIKQEASNTNTTEDTTNPTTAMNNFANYVSNLPSRFPDINARLFLVLSSNLLTTCLREISLSGGEGFGAWWIVRCWVDEYLAWSFEVGGFFQDDLQDALQHQESPSMLPSLQNHPPDQEYQQAQDEPGDMVFGNIDLLETSFDLDSKNISQQYAAAQQSQAESLLNFDTNIDNLLN